MKQLLFVALFFSFLLFLTTISCKHEPIINPEPLPIDTTSTTTAVNGDSTGWKCSPDSVYFHYDVLPVLIAACARSGCHDATTRAEGYVLSDYTNAIRKGVSAGRATNSTLYTVIADGSMPPRSSGITMTQAQKDVIAKWINQGAKNLSCNPNYGKCDTIGGAKFAAFVQPLVKNKCEGCHTGSNAGSSIKLTNYTEIKAAVATGKFWGSISYTLGYSAMPKGYKLSACELGKIDAWIKRGALNY